LAQVFPGFVCFPALLPSALPSSADESPIHKVEMAVSLNFLVPVECPMQRVSRQRAGLDESEEWVPRLSKLVPRRCENHIGFSRRRTCLHKVDWECEASVCEQTDSTQGLDMSCAEVCAFPEECHEHGVTDCGTDPWEIGKMLHGLAAAREANVSRDADDLDGMSTALGSQRSSVSSLAACHLAEEQVLPGTSSLAHRRGLQLAPVDTAVEPERPLQWRARSPSQITHVRPPHSSIMSEPTAADSPGSLIEHYARCRSFSSRSPQVPRDSVM